MPTKRRCVGYDDNGKEFLCLNEAGTPWTPIWCMECDERRRARISRQMQEILERLEMKRL